MKQINNEIKALFMGQLDLKTGKWFPIKKMTWELKRGNSYLGCSIRFIQGANKYLSLFPERKRLHLVPVENLAREMKYRDVTDSAWSNRMPVARPLSDNLRIGMGLDFNSAIDPVEYVSRSGGYRTGDKCGIFPEVAPDEQGNYNFIFRGVDAWVMSSDNKPELEVIPVGAKITLQPPEQEEIIPKKNKAPVKNSSDTPPEITRMKMYVDEQIVGYAPHYIKELYKRFREQLKVEIYHKIPEFPFEYQFLFLATVNQNVGIPFSETEYQPLAALANE